MTSDSDSYSPGLENVIAGETAIASVTDGIRYRGYALTDLAERVTFPETAHLLLHGELPTVAQLEEFSAHVAAAAMQFPESIDLLFRALPSDTPPMDALRSAVSVLAHFDPDAADNSRAASLRKAERLLGQIPVAIARFDRARKGLPPVPPRPELGHAASFLHMLTGQEPEPLAARAFDASLTLYAEQEFTASTFTARVVASTRSDLHSAVVAAVGALKGPLHGGANERVVGVLRAAGGPETAAAWVRAAIERKELVMGFGHRVYRSGDPRAKILKAYTRRVAEAAGQQQWEETAEVIERVMAEEKGLYPNIDWPTGRLYHALGLDVSLYTPLFAAARVAGWSAHFVEQGVNNRLIRPRARYTGPEPRQVPPG